MATPRQNHPDVNAWNDSFTGDFLWTNSNFCEAISDVMTPATYSMWEIYFEAVSFQITGYPLVGIIGGRPYINLSMIVSIGRAFGIKPRVMLQKSENLWGRVPEGIDIPLLPLTYWQTLRLTLPSLFRVRMALKVKPREVRTFIASCPGWCAAMRTRIRQAATPIELTNLWQGELRPYFGRAWRMVRATLEPNGVLRQSLIQLVGSADANALLSNLSGAGQLASLGPLVGISKMARGEINRTAYLEQYGHRGPHELELSIPRPVEDPTWLDQQVAMLVKSPVDVDALLARQRAEFDAAWKRLIQRHPHKRKSLQRQIKLAAASARLREETRSEATRIVWVLRELALRVSEWIDFEDRQDVFFLSLDEMIDILSGDQTALALIQGRKELYAQYSALPSYPAIIIGRFDPFQWAANPNRRSDLFDAHSLAGPKPAAITGFAGAAGMVEGLVRRLDRVEEGDQLKPGEILVTATTNVGWTPLFTLAAAVVTDVGAPLSHAAIVARELGIPAVVGCGNATLHLHTGDWVRVDGGQGTVEILNGSGI